MTEKMSTFSIKEILEEIHGTEGLPKELSSEAQLWDEILKKMTYVASDLLFPLIQEIHHKTYPKGTQIRPLATEYAVERGDTKKISSIRADITVLVGSRDIYHFECQLRHDGSMIFRMFEYDAHIALSYADMDQNGMQLEFPRSAVLYLTDNSKVPDRLECKISFPDGGCYTYQIPTVRVQAYTLQDIREKHLCILIPFLPLRFRRRLKKKSERLTKEELTSFYRDIILILDEEVKTGNLSETNRATILSLLGKATVRVFYQRRELLKEVITMTEPILKLEIEKYWDMLDQQRMQMEEMNRALQHKEKELQSMEQALQDRSQALQDKEQALQDTNQALQDTNQALQDKEQALQDKEQALAESRREIEALRKQLASLSATATPRL
ncbi:MAG: hypothetical protein J1E64_01800 [Acetatifactor sp.]|nr:hypothetical protein [Acetatifactor sp.]